MFPQFYYVVVTQMTPLIECKSVTVTNVRYNGFKIEQQVGSFIRRNGHSEPQPKPEV